MEQFYRKNYIKLTEINDLEFQIIEWKAQDEAVDDDADSETSESENCEYCNPNNYSQECSCVKEEYTIRCFGSTKEGVSVTCKINNFKPFYYIKVPSTFNKLQLTRFQSAILDSWVLKNYKRAFVSSSIVIKKDLYGFRNNAKYKYVKLVFNNYAAMMKSRYIFKKPIKINGVTNGPTKFKLYESNFEPFLRYCHIQDIRMAGWIQLPKRKYRITRETSNTQIEVEIDYNDVISLPQKHEMANFLQASWDIEVYSHDYTFPDPKEPKNEIFQIATTYKYYHDPSNEILVKQLLTLKKCSKINDSNVIVEECSSERELIKRWVDTISLMDPDIFYTYNGDSFDFMYLIERAKLYKLVTENGKKGYFLQKLSRLLDTPADIKKEYFSSSAYGDSEFNRVYIPGRLNYDLLIHYKRGMKKYSSYKLDHISNEILGEGKHDVTAKDIFKFYEKGTPDDIRHIAEYCIQDTDLLQKLVDKQLILTNIIQLANVTFVPIGFLTTRGQTIKVYSQILRKARQMDFLVPHTNFNEDVINLYIKTKDPHNLNEDDLNEYIEINCGKSQTTDKRPLVLSAKINEIVSDDTISVLCDTEITRDYFNISFKKNYSTYQISRLWYPDDLVEDSFTGATVLEPKPGLYLKDNIAVLDFASLYPTIMISRNLCFSTYVNNDKFRDLPNVNYETIAWDDQIDYKMRQTCQGVGKSGKSKGQVCGKQAYFEVFNENTGEPNYFCRIHDTLKKSRKPDEKYQKRDVTYNYTIVQPHKDENGDVINKGVVPALLEDLYAERKSVKKQMAEAERNGDKLLASILDSTQLAIKISLNSTYGFLGRRTGNLVLKELGSIVTSVGRMLIEQSKEYAEGPFLDYLKQNNLLKHTIQPKKLEMTKTQKKEFLKQFKR
jgi:DNA polymerase elongation subunit (family B)